MKFVFNKLLQTILYLFKLIVYVFYKNKTLVGGYAPHVTYKRRQEVNLNILELLVGQLNIICPYS